MILIGIKDLHKLLALILDKQNNRGQKKFFPDLLDKLEKVCYIYFEKFFVKFFDKNT